MARIHISPQISSCFFLAKETNICISKLFHSEMKNKLFMGLESFLEKSGDEMNMIYSS